MEVFCHPQKGEDDLGGGGEVRRVEVCAPEAEEEQMLGGWYLAEAESSQTPITALKC